MRSTRINRAGSAVAALTTAALVAASGSLAAMPAAAVAPTGEAVTIDRADYGDRMAALWMAECLANWTGLQVEHDRPNGPNSGPDRFATVDPFYTDADWGTEIVNGRGVTLTIDWDNPDPCGADDDTDIEYSYLHEMVENAGTVKLDPEDIANMWNTNVESFVWYSNSAADLLQESGVRTPSTTLSAANQHRNIIDAQLTTELFGALAPARPDVALDIAQLPIRTSAGGFATHAAQFNVLLYSLAPLVDQDASGAEQVRWLIDEARKYLPDSSRIAEIIDWVLAEYDANPGEPWENLRDRIYDRYQLNSAENGFNFIVKYESAINLAAQVAELLHGEGDLLRTLQIGALFGWDADNPTASNAGLLGLMKGTEAVEAEFTEAGINIVERFNANRTRVNLTDYLPDDPEATDTFDMMGERALTLVDETVRAGGGTVSDTSWTIPLVSAPASTAFEDLAKVNPDVDTYVTSGNNEVLRTGGAIQVTSNLKGDTALYTTDTSAWPSGRMFPTPVNTNEIDVVADGFDQDTRGQEEWERNPFFTGSTGGEDPVVEVTYDKAVEAESVRLIGGGIDASGGWATGATVQVRDLDGAWTDAPIEASVALNPEQPFQQTDLVFEDVLSFTGVRVTFEGTGGLLSLTEIDPVAPSLQVFKGFDQTAALDVAVSVDGAAAPTVDDAVELEAGSEAVLRYEITNTGEAALHGLVLKDENGGLVSAADATALAADDAGFLPGATVTIEVTHTVPEGAFFAELSAFARDDSAAPVRATGAWNGIGVTDSPSPEPTDPEPTTPAPVPSDPDTPGDPGSNGGQGTGQSGNGGALAQTGAGLVAVVVGALLLLAAGGGAVLIRRRMSHAG